MRSGESSGAPDQRSALELDPCVDADADAVRAVMALELGDARAQDARDSISVRVRCVDDGQEIRVEPWASLGQEGTRIIQLPASGEPKPAAREARARELALAIAELIRRLETTHPLRPEPTPPPRALPAIAAPIIIAPPALPAPPVDPKRQWRLGVVSSFDDFGGGRTLVGGDATVASLVGRWILVELRAGGRVAGDLPLPLGRLTARAGTISAAAGLDLSSIRRRVAFAFLFRAQGYLVQFRSEFSNEGKGQISIMGAFVVAGAPRIAVAVTRRVSLTADAALGVALHGILVRVQGTERRSLSGVTASGSLGAEVAF